MVQFYKIEIKCMNFKKEFGGCEYTIKLNKKQDIV